VRYFTIAVLFFISTTTAIAFSPVLTEITQPYEITTLSEDVSVAQEYLGELTGFPVMYEITSDEPFTLHARVQQQYRSAGKPIPFSLISIRQNDRGGGVTEVSRVNSSDDDWSRTKDSQLGMSLWSGSVLTAEVEPGTYRIEISTPENSGKYLIQFGADDSSKGYFTNLAGVWRTQQFFGLSSFNMLTSSYVYYPLGILFLLFLVQRVWKYWSIITRNVS
jgi:hypothetical protein